MIRFMYDPCAWLFDFFGHHLVLLLPLHVLGLQLERDFSLPLNSGASLSNSLARARRFAATHCIALAAAARADYCSLLQNAEAFSA